MSEQVKRYRIRIAPVIDPYGPAQLDPDGYWCVWKDVEPIITGLEAENKRLEAEVERLRELTKPPTGDASEKAN